MRKSLFWSYATLLLALPVSQGHADEIQRCEGTNGVIVYSNKRCPSGMQPTKSVDPMPPVSKADTQAARARARRAEREVRAIEKRHAAEEKARARAWRAARKEDEAHKRTCQRLMNKVNRAKDNVEFSTTRTRAKYRRALTRAEEEYEQRCLS